MSGGIRVYRAERMHAPYPWVVEATSVPWRRLPRPRRFLSWAEAMRYADSLTVYG